MTVSRQDKLPATPTNLRQQMLDNLGAPSLAQRQSPTVNELGGWIEHGLCYGISSKDGRTAARLLLDRFNIVPKDAALAPGNGAVEANRKTRCEECNLLQPCSDHLCPNAPSPAVLDPVTVEACAKIAKAGAKDCTEGDSEWHRGFRYASTNTALQIASSIRALIGQPSTNREPK